ncbi:MAG TPA: hypothetical protein VGM50_18140, partial [Gemmatimonadaceae bacterium]
MRNLQLISLPAVALLAGMVAAQTTKSASHSKLTIDQLVQIKHPSGHQWTPDGSHIWFVYDDGGVNNVWAVAADGSGPPVALTSYPESQTAAGSFWSKDGQTFFFQRDGGASPAMRGGLLAVSVKGGTPHAAWPSAANGHGFSLPPDGARVAFLVGQGRAGADRAGGGGGGATGGRRGNGGGRSTNAPTATSSGNGVDLIVHTIASNTDQTIAHADGNIVGMSWSPDGAKLAFTS